MSIEAICTLGQFMVQPSNAASSSAAETTRTSSFDWARTVHRALRGRYRLTVFLALLGGTVGGALGWRWAGPLFRSEGMVRIASALPAVIQPTDQNQPIPMFESFIQAQQGLVTSRAVMEAAMRDPLWNTPLVRSDRPSAAQLATGIKVDVRPHSENLQVSYTDPNPAVASAAVESTIGAYAQSFEQQNQQLEEQRLQLLEDYRNRLAAQLSLAKGPEPATQPSATAGPPPSPEKIAMVDLGMRHLLDERDQIQDELDRARIYYGESHLYVERLRSSMDDVTFRIHAYVNEYVAMRAAMAAMATAVRTAAGEQPTALAAPLSASMQQAQSDLDDANRRIEVLKVEAAMPKRLEIVSTGDFPLPVPSRQIKVTTFGAASGSGFAIAIMVVAGLFRRRYKYCSEIAETLSAQARFIAALPYLNPDDDLQPWEDAARCVHHLRQSLQQHSSVYLFTSADWGEGRTSLAMSMALSLCGAGIRTLLIDADLMNRGLTRTLKLDDGPGFFELLDGGDFTPSRVSPNSLAIMPVGQATEADGLSVSESVLSPLLARARACFDVILIDAGPVLARIETIEMARQVDGVVLTVARGQQRSSVERAVKELEMAEANIAGVIFNRVGSKDFYRSIQRRGPVTGPTSHPRPVQHALCDFGPLVRSVAMSLNKEIELSRIIGTSVRGAIGHDKQVA
jgi:protein-tyrosine kinase